MKNEKLSVMSCYTVRIFYIRTLSGVTMGVKKEAVRGERGCGRRVHAWLLGEEKSLISEEARVGVTSLFSDRPLFTLLLLYRSNILPFPKLFASLRPYSLFKFCSFRHFDISKSTLPSFSASQSSHIAQNYQI